jgi:NAD(P)H-hydrate epimerase
MKWITVEGIRDAEQVAFAQRNLPSYTAMCRAGAAVARQAEQMMARAQIKRCVVLCGPGNNGGDGFIAARCLKEDGFDVSVYMTCVAAHLKGDAARAWKDLCATGLQPHVLPSLDAWLDNAWSDPAVSLRHALIIDALLGIGAKGVPTGAVAAAIHWINGAGTQCPILSIDVPSGLDANAGTAQGEVVHADATVTFSRPKIGFASPKACAYLGDLSVVDIGIPGDLLETYECLPPEEVELIAEPELRHYLRPERLLDSHKRSYGHAMVIGGSQMYPHAPVLSALAAYRAGCGLVSLDVPDASRCAAAHWVPEAIFTDPSLDFVEAAMKCDAIAIGPGMGAFDAVRMDILQTLVNESTLPRTVIDADALTALAALREGGWEADKSTLRLILTPHPGEAARLLGVSAQEVQSARPEAVRAIASTYHAITVLKGHHTLVAEPGGSVHLCMGGNPGMATAGTGDLLTGIIAGLLARGLGTEDAACLGVYHHAAAGDRAVFRYGQESLMATDLFRTLYL